MHWYDLLIYGVSGLSIVTALVIGVLAYRFFKRH